MYDDGVFFHYLSPHILSAIQRVKGGTPNKTIYKRLKEDSCYNIAVAGAIMKLYLQETNGDIMLEVVNYPSYTLHVNTQYQLRVIQVSY